MHALELMAPHRRPHPAYGILLRQPELAERTPNRQGSSIFLIVAPVSSLDGVHRSLRGFATGSPSVSEHRGRAPALTSPLPHALLSPGQQAHPAWVGNADLPTDT